MVQIVANQVGVFFCVTYFMYVEPLNFTLAWSRDLAVVVVLCALLFALGTVMAVRWERDMKAAWRLFRQGRPAPKDLLARAQGRVLNWPWFSALISLQNWFIAAVAMTIYNYFWGPQAAAAGYGPGQSLRVGVGILLAGVASAAIVYFAQVEVIRAAIPWFFPQGGLSQVQGVYRLGVRARLSMTFLMVGLGPLVLVALIVYHHLKAPPSPDPGLAAQGLMIIIFYFLAGAAALALVLTALVARSVALPVKELERATRRVREGDLSVRVAVRDTDELGSLAESFNQMTAGLAERERIKEAFGRFVTPAIARAILANPPRPGGASTEVTVLFSDIRSYTRLSERMSPGEVIAFLNAYFSHMVPAVEKHQGLVYQFVGDAIMAVFNAPLATPDHATLAVKAGLEMLKALERFNAGRSGEPVRMGIGVHSGPVVAGIIGSQDRMEYRVVGDTVNLAARVEGLTKKLGAPLIISQATRQRLSLEFALRDLSTHAVKGRQEPVRVFAVQGGPAALRS
jgi:class 3 adenylate cyclase